MPRRADKAKVRPTRRRKLAVLLIAVCGAATVLGLLAFDRLPSTLGDNAEFAILGSALARGKGYRNISHPDERPSTKYPPGFPIMLAGWMRLFGESAPALKAEVFIFYVLAMAVTLLLARRFLDDTLALIATGLIVTSWTVMNYSHQVLSDIPFTLCSLAALYLLDRERPSPASLYGGIALCVWAYFIRTAGISLVIAAVVFLFLKARRREAFILIGVFAAAAAAWGIRNYMATGEGSRYLSVLLATDPYDPEMGLIGLSGLLSRMLVNFISYVTYLLPANLFPTILDLAGGREGGVPRAVIMALLVGVAVLGAYVVRRKNILVGTYLVLYFGIYLVWPTIWRSDRFMIPVAPLVAIYFFAGLRRILMYFDLRRVIIVVVAAAFMLSNTPSLAKFIGRHRGYDPGWYEYLQTAVWVRNNTPPGSIVLCRKPFLYYAFSHRQSVSYPFTRDANAMVKYLLEVRPDYIVIDNFGGPTTTDVYLLPVLTKMQPALELVYETGEPVNVVLKFTPGRLGVNK